MVRDGLNLWTLLDLSGTYRFFCSFRSSASVIYQWPVPLPLHGVLLKIRDDTDVFHNRLYLNLLLITIVCLIK